MVTLMIWSKKCTLYSKQNKVFELEKEIDGVLCYWDDLFGYVPYTKEELSEMLTIERNRSAFFEQELKELE